MDTALDIITDSQLIIGAAQSGQALPAHEAEQGLRALKDILALMAVDGGLGPVSVLTPVTVTGAGSYTVGEGGNISIAFPYALKNAFYLLNGYTRQIDTYNIDEYRSNYSNASVGAPVGVSYLATYPLGTLYINGSGIPGGTLLLEFDGMDMANLGFTDTLQIEPSRLLLIKYMLAERLAPTYGASLSNEAQAQYDRIAVNVRADQLVLNPLQTYTPGSRGRSFSYRTGNYR